MEKLDARFAGAVPEIYERHLGALIFEPYAADLGRRLARAGARHTLETAAGTGLVTRVLAEQLEDGARLVATDLNPAMLAVARKRVVHPRVTFEEADATSLAFEDASFDAVVCQFGVMFFPDKVLGFREARRVLRRGAPFVFSVWDALSANEVSDVAARGAASLFQADPPRFLERTPFGYFDPERIRADVVAAGFTHVELEHVDRTTTAPSAESAAIGLVQGTPLRNEIEARGKGRLGEATEAARAALVARFGEGPFENRMRAIVVTARG